MTERGVTMAQSGPENAPAKRAASEWPKTIQTTMEPSRDLQVDEREYLDLERQGLIRKGGK